MKKPRSDALLLNLPEPQQAQLAEWLLAGMTYAQAQSRVQDEFQVSASLSVFGNFYETICIPILAERRADLAKVAQALVNPDDSNPRLFDKAIFAQLKQRIFELCLAPTTTEAEAKMLFDCLMKWRDRDLAEAKLELERRKVEFLEAQAHELANPKRAHRRDPLKPLTPEERDVLENFIAKKMGMKCPPPRIDIVKPVSVAPPDPANQD